MSRHQDPNYNDRKLRPIYDCLDNRCYKKALQEIDKLLKKAKSQQYIKVLKSLTLLRMSRQKDAIEILDEIFNETPTDDSTLQTMSMCYREMDKNETIPLLYENALKTDSTNEKLHTQLFMAYVRLQNYKKQHFTAVNLFKVHSKSPYYFWAVMSVYMQSLTAENEELSIKITLPLAEKMCQKFRDDNGFESESQINLYLMVLEKQKKYSAMIETIDTYLKNGIISDHMGFVSYRKVKLLNLEKRFPEAFECLINLIKINNDQYDYYIEAFKVATMIDIDSSSEIISKDFEYSFKILDLIEEMCTSNTTTAHHNGFDDKESKEIISKRSPRGPFIAKIIIFDLIKKSASMESQIPESIRDKFYQKVELLKNEDYIIDLLFDYFQRFGSKFVCFKDLTYIFHNIFIKREQIEKLLLKIKFSLLNFGNEREFNEIHQSLVFYYLSHYFQTKFSNNAIERAVESKMLIEFFEKLTIVKGDDSEQHQKAKENSSDQKEQQPFDPFIYLFLNKMFADIDISKQLEPEYKNLIFDLMVFLDWTTAYNKNDFYVKLIYIRLSNLIGAALTSHHLYESLEIKLIQNDTLGHYFLSSLMSSGIYSIAQKFLNSCWKFYTFNFKDASDYIISCYKYGSFTKIEEILSFNYKLENSLQFHLFFIERLFVQLLTDCKSHSTFNTFAEETQNLLLNGNFDINWDQICDNRDFQLLNTNHHEFQAHVVETIRLKTFTDEILWLRYRFCLMQSITVASYLSEKNDSSDQSLPNSETNNKAFDKFNLKMFCGLIDQLEELIKVATNTARTSDDIKYYLEGPEPSRLKFYFTKSYSQIILHLMNYTACLLKTGMNHQTNLDSNNIDFGNILTEIVENIRKLSENYSLQTIRIIFEQMSNIVETIGICITLLDISFHNLLKINKLNKKSKKKRSENFQIFDSELLATLDQNLSTVHDCLSNCLKQLISFLNENLQANIQQYVNSINFELKLELTSITTAIKSVKSKILSSYEESILQLMSALTNKQKYLSSLNITSQTA